MCFLSKNECHPSASFLHQTQKTNWQNLFIQVNYYYFFMILAITNLYLILIISNLIIQNIQKYIRNQKIIRNMSLTSKQTRNAKKYRIVFLGDQGVGKTSIIQRYTTDRFDEVYNSTVGIDFNVKDITRNGVHYRLQMWDTAGQERYRSLIPTYLKNAHCVVFVYDITRTKTLQGLNDWYKLFTDNQQAPGIVVGNKIDLVNTRKVGKTQGQQFCKLHKLKYLQVSAKSGKKISELFDMLLDMILQQEKQEMNPFAGKSSDTMKQANQVSTKPEPIKLGNTKVGIVQKVKQNCCQ